MVLHNSSASNDADHNPRVQGALFTGFRPQNRTNPRRETAPAPPSRRDNDGRPPEANQPLIEMIPSISTEIWPGSEPMPTAERPCLPFSPNTSTNRSDMPLATFG